MTVDFWDRMMAINLRGTFLAVRAAARHLRAGTRGGAIVVYTSTASQRGSAHYNAYATSKGAQILFMRSMALELAPDRIRVNCIGRAKVSSPDARWAVGAPTDVANATAYLLSDLAQFMTGTTMTVDGGIDLRG